MFNGSVNAKYEWQHAYHDPLTAPDLTSSRLPKAIKDWINEQVESNKDWKAIKATLRLSETNLDAFDMFESFSKIPAGLLVRYVDVQNVIFAKMNKLSRKSSVNMESIRLWMNDMQDTKHYSTLFSVDPDMNGPFLVFWMSPWQKIIFENAEEWCIVSTHKTCKSFVKSTVDCYLYTIVVRNKATNKGVPVCFFITNREVTPVLVMWLNWVKDNTSIHPQRIMIDCSATEI
ncbi:hypothetical protein BDB01DRAFT_725385 [Pilobolus umbonatus]|nr:hypothetical protein BDB01DRAFT_725385 [Pilobolus umbonatus]